MLGAYLRDVNFARAINCDSIGRFKLFDACNEDSVWREFFYSPIVCIGDKDVSSSIECKAVRIVKLPLSTSFSVRSLSSSLLPSPV